jgi:hypothetical protein
MRNILFLGLIFSSLSCKPKFEGKPNNLVSKEKMINIMADIHRAEGVVNNLNIQSTDTSQFIFRKLEAKIFKQYEVDTTAYIKSYKYYLINAEEFSEMYKEVVATIKQKNKVDSLANSKLNKFPLDTHKVNNTRPLQLGKLIKQKIKLDSLKAQYGIPSK